MACSNPSLTVLSKYLCVSKVINYLSLSLWKHMLMPFGTPLLVAVPPDTSKPQAPATFHLKQYLFLLY